MNREVEERLVAMYFDNRDFEKNAKETINTLGQLKESMNLEDSVKGFDVFSKMKRNAGMDQMQKSANKLKDTFSSIGPILNKAFQVGTGPLRSMEHALSSLQGYVNKYLGFDFASKIVSGVENAMRSLTVQPISQGWAQYENEVDSVKTIMSSTGESIEVVTKHLDDLRDYADKTVYSLQDMTSNLGKFTNNGVELDKATKAMMGISNAAALAGQGTQQASMAMYNMSQAIGVGKMTSIDWKSIENANMATIQLKDSLLRVAAAQENLKTKKDASGGITYWYAKDSNGKEIKDPKKWVEVNAKNFRDTLKEGWLTSDTLIATMTAFSGQKMSLQDWESIGIKDKELIAYLEKTGQQALEAASQVRTFSKMMTTLKDSVASGWSQSFKYLFGDAEEAATFWTDVSNRIGDAMSSGAERRNDLLKKWKNTREILGTEVIDTGSNGGGLVERYIYGRNGREILIDSLNNLMDVFASLGSAVKKAFGSVFQTLGSGDLFSKTQEFEKLTLRIKEWLGPLDDSNSRLNKLFRIIRGGFSAFKLWKDSIRSAADAIVRFLFPSADSVLDVLAMLGDFMYNLSKMRPEEIIAKIGEKLKKGWEKIKSWFTPKDLFDKFGNKIGVNIPILQWINNLWDQLKAAGGQVLTDLGLGGVVDFFISVKDEIVKAWNGITGWPGWTDVGNFFNDIGKWFLETFDIAIDFFTKPNEDGQTGFSQWIALVFVKVKSVWDRAVAFVTPIFEEIGRFFSSIWDWITEKFGIVVDFFKKPNEDGQTGFSQWIALVFIKVKSVWDRAVAFVTPIFEEIGKFFGSVWDWISDKFGIAIDFFTKPNESGETEFSQWIKLVLEEISNAWNAAMEVARPVLEEIGKFFLNAWDWILGLAGGGGGSSSSEGETETEATAEKVEKGVDTVKKSATAVADTAEEAAGKAESAKSLLDTLSGFVTGIVDSITKFFAESGINDFAGDMKVFWDGLVSFVSGALKALGEVLDAVGKYLHGDKSLFQLITDGSLSKLLEVVGITLIPQLVNLVMTLAGGAISKVFGVNLISIGQEVMGLGIGIAAVVAAIVALKEFEIEPEVIQKYATWLAVIGGALAAVMTAAGYFSGKTSKTPTATPAEWDKTVNRLISGLERVLTINIVLDKLPTIIQTIASYRSSFGDGSMALEVIETVGGTLLAIMTASLVFVGISAIADKIKMTGAGLGKVAVAVVSVIGIVTGILAIIGNAIKDPQWAKDMAAKAKSVRESTNDVFGIITDVIKSIMSVPTDFVGNLRTSVTGEMSEEDKTRMMYEAQQNQLALAIEGLTKLSEVLSPEKLQAISDLVGNVSELKGFLKYSYGKELAGDFSNFATGFKALVVVLSELLTDLSGDDNLYRNLLNDEAYRKDLDQFFGLVGTVLSLFDAFNENVLVLFGKRTTSLDVFYNLHDLISPTDEGEASRFRQFALDMVYAYLDIHDAFKTAAVSKVNTGELEGDAERMQNMIALITELWDFMDYTDRMWDEYFAATGQEYFGGDRQAYAEYSRQSNIELIDFVLGSIETMTQHINEYLAHSTLLTGGASADLSRIIGNAMGILGVFGENGIGSSVWKSNYRAFTSMMNDSEFVETYISNVEKIYERLKGSSLAGDNGIEFDGINIVANLFGSIQDALNADTLPDLDAHVITDKIVESIGLGKTAFAAAVRDMIQAGIDQITVPTAGENGELVYSWMPEIPEENKEILNWLSDPSKMAEGLLSGMDFSQYTESFKTMFNPDSEIMQMFSGLGTELEKNIPDFDLAAVLSEKGYMLVDENGEPTGIMADLTSAIEQVNTDLSMNPLKIRITPVFELDDFNRKELQSQLDKYNFAIPMNQSMPELAIDFTALKTSLDIDAIKLKLDMINSSIVAWGSSNYSATNNLGSHMDGIRNEIAGMHMVLDTGVMVGQMLPMIDAGLYNRALLEYRSGSSPRAANGAYAIP